MKITMKPRRSRKSSCLLIIFLLLALNIKVYGQPRTLSRDEFIKLVKNYHPTVRLAYINIDKSNANIQMARGAFDPSVSFAVRDKELKNTLYYSYFNSEIALPTWYGVDLKAGVDKVDGARVDPETTVGDVSYVGVKFSLSSLLYDKRRAALQQAYLYQEMSESEQKLAINNVLFDGLIAYWQWVKEYELLQIVTSQIEKTKDRLQMVKGEVEQGARPAIDTVEAYAQYMTLLQQQNNAEQLVKNAKLELSAFLWLEDGVPYELPGNIVPENNELNAQALSAADIGAILPNTQTHPKLKIMDMKMDMLELDRKLKIQNLIPKLSVNAAMLDYNSLSKSSFKVAPVDNYKFTVDVNIPLLMREARGSLKVANLKIKELTTERTYLQTQLNVKAHSYYNEYMSLKEQIKNYDEVQAAYTTLYNGEVMRFKSGESTLFLVNSRELKLMEALQKMVELKAKQQKAYTGILHAAGMLM